MSAAATHSATGRAGPRPPIRRVTSGAILVTEARDVIDQLAPLLGHPLPPAESLEEPPDLSATPPPQDAERAAVVEALGPTPVAIDEIIRHTGLHPAQVMLVLLELDLAGRLERHPGAAVSLVIVDP